MQRHPRHSRRAGFTLLELVLVLIVMALLLTAAAPSLGGWSRGQKLDNAADRFLAAAHWARAEAIATAADHRLVVDVVGGSYRVTRLDGEQYAPVAGEFGRDATLPPGLRIEVVRQDESRDGAIDFYPSGRISPASVHIFADWGGLVTLRSAGVAESLRRVSATGGP